MNRFQFVEDHKALYGVKRLCRVLQVSRSGFYRWLKGAAARLARCQADERLAEQVRRIHGEHDRTYGSPRVTAELRAAGIVVNHKRVERVMREHGIARGAAAQEGPHHHPGAGRGTRAGPDPA